MMNECFFNGMLAGSILSTVIWLVGLWVTNR